MFSSLLKDTYRTHSHTYSNALAHDTAHLRKTVTHKKSKCIPTDPTDGNNDDHDDERLQNSFKLPKWATVRMCGAIHSPYIHSPEMTLFVDQSLPPGIKEKLFPYNSFTIIFQPSTTFSIVNSWQLCAYFHGKRNEIDEHSVADGVKKAKHKHKLNKCMNNNRRERQRKAKSYWIFICCFWQNNTYHIENFHIFLFVCYYLQVRNKSIANCNFPLG